MDGHVVANLVILKYVRLLISTQASSRQPMRGQNGVRDRMDMGG
jgi:hypothetical protein